VPLLLRFAAPLGLEVEDGDPDLLGVGGAGARVR